MAILEDHRDQITVVRGLIAEVPDQMVEGPRSDGRGPRPDNRGPRPDNRGSRPDRGSDKPSFIQPAAEPMMEKSEFSRRSKDRKKKVEEIDEFAAKKAKLSEKKLSSFDRKRSQKKVFTPSPSQRRRDLKRRKDLKKTGDYSS